MQLTDIVTVGGTRFSSSRHCLADVAAGECDDGRTSYSDASVIFAAVHAHILLDKQLEDELAAESIVGGLLLFDRTRRNCDEMSSVSDGCGHILTTLKPESRHCPRKSRQLCV